MTWRIDASARATLFSLKDDPTQARLFRQLRGLIVHIVQAPDSDLSRQHRYSNGVWGVSVPGQDWMILWQLQDGDVAVLYVGPAL